MPDGAPSPPTDPLAADERAIAAEVARAGLTNDPLRHVYAGILRAVREIRTLLARAREPLPPEAQREAVQGIVRQATGEIARGLTRLMPWTVGAALAGAFRRRGGGDRVVALPGADEPRAAERRDRADAAAERPRRGTGAGKGGAAVRGRQSEGNHRVDGASAGAGGAIGADVGPHSPRAPRRHHRTRAAVRLYQWRA